MGLAQEKVIQEFCEAWGDGTSQTKPNVEKLLSMMAEDAELQPWVPGGPIVRGRSALREEIHRQMRFSARLCPDEESPREGGATFVREMPNLQLEFLRDCGQGRNRPPFTLAQIRAVILA